MAKQTSILTYTGKLGDTIGVRTKHGYYTKSRPKKVRQTRATRHAARRFGRASSTAALIRKAICAIADIRKDEGYMNRLTKALIPSAGMDLNSIVGYCFNQEGDNSLPTTFIYLRIDLLARKVMEHRIMDRRTQPPGIGTWIVVAHAADATEIIGVQQVQAYISYPAPQNASLRRLLHADTYYTQKE